MQRPKRVEKGFKAAARNKKEVKIKVLRKLLMQSAEAERGHGKEI
jgi:hypothetical protein